MKLLNVHCTNCGAAMKVSENAKVITCEYCNQDFILDDEVKRFMLTNAEQAGYDFEKGRHRAQKDAGLVPGKTQTVIDNSQKIENLYLLARRAIQEQDYKSALKYYEQLLLEQPDKWEPVYYAAYSKIADCKAEEIKENAQVFKNKLESAFILLKADNSADTEKELERIAISVDDLVRNLSLKILDKSVDDTFKNNPNEYYVNDLNETWRYESLVEILDVLINRLAPYTANERLVYHKFTAKKQVVHIQSLMYSNEYADKKRIKKRLQKEQKEIAAYDPDYKIEKVTKIGACYIATAVYGSYDCPQVWVLRRFRDEFLMPTRCGRLFVKTYYAVSPRLLQVLGDTKTFKAACNKVLDVFVGYLKNRGLSDKPYEDRD